MKKIGLIVNRLKDPELRVAQQIRSYFTEAGVFCHICEMVKNDSEEITQSSYRPYRYTDMAALPKDLDCVIALGGDGTLLQAARDLYRLGIPILGVNLGHLGYLAELDSSAIPEALAPLLCDEYKIEERMMLQGSIVRDGNEIMTDIALNDIVLTRFGHTHVIQFDVNVDGHYLMEYKADGLIAATPTGSTAYNLSAGGPLIIPTANLVALTPVCAHALATRSVILPPDSMIEIVIRNSSPFVDSKDSCVVTFDGDSTVKLWDGDRICITKSSFNTKLVKLGSTSFIELLRNKMQ